jgi:hypothetical protein
VLDIVTETMGFESLTGPRHFCNVVVRYDEIVALLNAQSFDWYEHECLVTYLQPFDPEAEAANPQDLQPSSIRRTHRIRGGSGAAAAAASASSSASAAAGAADAEEEDAGGGTDIDEEQGGSGTGCSQDSVGSTPRQDHKTRAAAVGLASPILFARAQSQGLFGGDGAPKPPPLPAPDALGAGAAAFADLGAGSDDGAGGGGGGGGGGAGSHAASAASSGGGSPSASPSAAQVERRPPPPPATQPPEVQYHFERRQQQLNELTHGEKEILTKEAYEMHAAQASNNSVVLKTVFSFCQSGHYYELARYRDGRGGGAGGRPLCEQNEKLMCLDRAQVGGTVGR